MNDSIDRSVVLKCILKRVRLCDVFDECEDEPPFSKLSILLRDSICFVLRPDSSNYSMTTRLPSVVLGHVTLWYNTHDQVDISVYVLQ
jgi:hypothetical protein